MKNIYSNSIFFAFIFSLLLLTSVTLQAQNVKSGHSSDAGSNTAKFAGNWYLQEAHVAASQSDNASRVSKENSEWADLLSGEIPLTISKDGKAEYVNRGSRVNAGLRVEKDQLVFTRAVKVVFKSQKIDHPQAINAGEKENPANAASSTVQEGQERVSNYSKAYQYAISNNTLTLRLITDLHTEEYIFIRK